MSKPLRWLLLASIVVLATGCRTDASLTRANTGDVGRELLLPPAGAARLELQPTQAFVYPNLIDPVAMPQYPNSLLPLRLAPVDVCIEVDIDEAGGVSTARPRVHASTRPV